MMMPKARGSRHADLKWICTSDWAIRANLRTLG